MKWKYYHTVWVMLFLGWFIAYVDRNLMSPIVTYMIENEIAFFKDVESPHALAGLLSTLFFAGYMAMQFPAGYIGDRMGRKPILVMSMVWAAIGSVLTAVFAKSMLGLLGARVLTGLGEGCYYSNDRALITETTPKEKLGVGMGVSFVGLGMGLVGASVGGAWTLKWAVDAFGPEKGWYIPFYIWAIPTLVIAFLLMVLIKKPQAKQEPKTKSDPEAFVPGNAGYLKTLWAISKYVAVFFVLIMGVAYTGSVLNVGEIGVSVMILLLAVGIMFYIMTSLGKQVGPVFFNKNLQLVYWAALPTLWSLWFYGFWAVKVIKDAASSGISVAGTTAAMFGLAALVGLPLMGKIADMFYSRGKGRKPALILAMSLHAVFIFALAYYLYIGGNSISVLGFLVFMAGVFLFGTWSVSFALTADFAPPALMASAFGVWNLIAEIGAILSPVVSGALRDATQSWVTPVTLDGILMVAGIICISFVAEPAANVVVKLKTSLGVSKS
ncbi:MAG: MFS transporter [Thermincola sp.]|jgi:MFS family permease|nr:MFS transporter [Thermincola sp.]MDT3702022.1 MFS transporter [Thermincola sp.]